MDPALLPLVYAVLLLVAVAGAAGAVWAAWGRSDAQRDRADACTAHAAAVDLASAKARIASLEAARDRDAAQRADAQADAAGVVAARDRLAEVADDAGGAVGLVVGVRVDTDHGDLVARPVERPAWVDGTP